MRLLTHTNIIVDDFELTKDYKPFTFIHFLTHFHADHWQGMTPLWNYGHIFCSQITKNFILNKFPKIQNIHSIEMNKLYKLNLLTQQIVDIENNEEFTIEIAAFDANHIPGASMFLFRGFMGTILHTGDFRFREEMLQNEILNQARVDELIFDNTYCNPMFKFPKAEVVANQMIEIIQKNKGKHVYIAMGALGKENIVIQLCKTFNTKIIITQEKYYQMQASQIANLSLFTFERKGYFIEIIKHKLKQEILANTQTQPYIIIETDFLMLNHTNPDQIQYIVPYSLHSNYQEMKSFVKAIKPAILRKLVIPYQNFTEYRRKVRINPLKAFKGYLKRIEQNGESGYSELIRTCTDFTKLSQQYLQWMHEGVSQKLLENLGIQVEPDRQNRKRKVDRVQPQPSLKQRIIELEKQCIYSKKEDKKESLDEIADKLRATNKNKSIEQYINKIEKNEEYEELQKQNQENEIYFNLLQNFINEKQQ